MFQEVVLQLWNSFDTFKDESKFSTWLYRVSLKNILYKAIKQLSEVERAIVLLYLDEKNYKEIAETLGISSINARVKMTRAKAKLKKIMEQWT